MSIENERRAQRLAEVFAALSHTRRVEIHNCLLEGEKSVGELCGCERLRPSTQPNMSQHLGILRSAGLVLERREGSRVIYRVSSARIGELIKSADSLTQDHLRQLLRAA
ncbi:MAG: metalloregulator ArsR/SmtB family transcription factor [Thermoplasmata archaeon]|nr:metalloregulator ArsR/SmtB family transcription factor [Thermoplasmata archaeon]